jgi:surface protein
MADKIVFRGFKQVNGLAEGFSESSLEQGYVYLVRTNADKTEGYIYFNGKKYGNIDSLDTKYDEMNKYPIVYKTIDGTGTIYAYKDASSSSYDTITGSSKSGVVWIDKDYEKIKFVSGFTSLNLSRVDTRNITSMGQMFYGCDGITSLDLSFLDTSKVTNMSSMFAYCSGLTSLDLSSFDTTNVTDMSNMFSNCSGLTSLDVSSFDTSRVTNMTGMFAKCCSLTSLDLRNFDTSQVTNMLMLFGGCSGLTSLDLSNFNTSQVRLMVSMFSSCSNLTSLDLSNFDTTNVLNMNSMFISCSKLSKLTLSSSFFNSANVTTYDFYPLSAWTNTESLANFVSVLPTITTTKTLKLNSNTKSALTADQTSTITTKGWTIA